MWTGCLPLNINKNGTVTYQTFFIWNYDNGKLVENPIRFQFYPTTSDSRIRDPTNSDWIPVTKFSTRSHWKLSDGQGIPLDPPVRFFVILISMPLCSLASICGSTRLKALSSVSLCFHAFLRISKYFKCISIYYLVFLSFEISSNRCTNDLEILESISKLFVHMYISRYSQT